MVECVFFDLDATLLNEERADLLAVEKFYSLLSIEVNYRLSTFVERWNYARKKYYQMFVEGEISLQEHRRKRIREVLNNSSLSNAEADDYFSKYLEASEKNWELFSDVLPCLDSLKNLRLGVITNGKSIKQRKKLNVLGIADRFETIVISEEVGVAKPKSEIFAQACSSVGLPSSRCIYIGDKLDDDAIASAKAGLHGVWLNRHKQEPTLSIEAITILSNLKELTDYVNHLLAVCRNVEC